MGNKIRVLQVVGSLRIGGAETVAMNLYRYIDREKFEFHYLVYGNKIGDYEQEVESLGGKVIHIDYSPRNLKKFKFDFFNVLSVYGPYSIVHAHMMFHNGIVLSLAKKSGVPITISHAHSTNDGGNPSNVLTRIIRDVYISRSRRLILKNADLLIACGEEAGNYLYGEKAYKRKGYLLRNGIDIEKYKFDEKTRKTIRSKYHLEDKIVFGCIGHFDKVKNHAFLVDAFQQAHKHKTNTYLVLLGDGNLKAKIERKCKEEGISDSVLFMGNVNNVNEWLQGMDYLLMPSLYEGIPVTLVEAQASGIKCMVSDKVSKEVNVTGEIEYLPLDLEKWTDRLVKLDDFYKRCEGCIEKLQTSGYDEKANIQKMQNKYIEMIEKNSGEMEKNEINTV